MHKCNNNNDIAMKQKVEASICARNSTPWHYNDSGMSFACVTHPSLPEDAGVVSRGKGSSLCERVATGLCC